MTEQGKAAELQAKLEVYQEIKEVIEDRIAELSRTAKLHEIANAVMVKMLFPPDLQKLLSFEEREDVVIVRPIRFLGPEKFAPIASIARENKGEYISAGKDSHFRMPLKTR